MRVQWFASHGCGVSQAAFEQAVAKEMSRCADGLLRVDPRDPLGVAKLQVEHATYKRALELLKQVNRTIDDEDGQ